MYCISVNYKKADVGFREKMAFPEDVQRALAERTAENVHITGCVLLCTCNRTELYFSGDTCAISAAKALLSEFGGVSEGELAPVLMIFSEDAAVRHLFKVACGIESMVMGEDEILGQTKNAFRSAMDRGFTSYELNMIFQRGIACAKRIKTETTLSGIPVSTATLAANAAADFGGQVNVLVIGASGKIGSSTVKNLLTHKNVSVSATRRSCGGEVLFSPEDVAVVGYSDRYSAINRADVVISATGSPHYTITKNRLEKSVTENRKRLFIDLAVPHDIEETVADVPWASVLDIDHFGELARKNNLMKMSGAQAAETIIEQETDELKKEFLIHDFLPEAEHIGKKLAEVPFEKLLFRLKAELDHKELSHVLKILEELGE
ncbi:MAG: glutamyl-tRNA reductase [Oscillospiraceae bacterium]|nr:glutamyl-tRNA reductase [Oscillospiraceae bacterium]